MCTVTWWREPGRYEVFFNRDELKSRRPELPPSPRTRNGVRLLSPEDSDSAGTWIGVNAFGVTLAILNHQPDEPYAPPEHRKSRGQLLLSLTDCQSPAEVGSRLNRHSVDLCPYPPFFILALALGAPPSLWEWQGRQPVFTEDATARLPLTTSSFSPKEVIAARVRLFRARFPNPAEIRPADLLAYHRQYDPERGAQSVCMERPDARTLSFSHIRVDTTKIEFDYAPRIPGSGNFEPASHYRIARVDA